jgi:hypothetical protein
MEPLEAGDPRTAGPYRLTSRLGSGGMGRVFLGESPAGRRVAVKLVREELASSPGFRDRFRREAKLAMRAGGFWAAQVVDADPDAAVPWIASQYVDGPSLAEHVTRRGPLDESEVRRLVMGLAEALAAFHKGGLVHRDLKPSNILLVDDGPRVIDFGISKALETLETPGAPDLTRVGTVLGTPGFMSPEQARGHPAGPPSDVFSLGSLLVYAATGTGAFGHGSSHALLFRVVYEAPDLSNVPYGLRELAQECLRKSPEHRPAAEELVTRLANPHPATVLDPDADRGTPDAGEHLGPDGLANTGPQQGSSAGARAPRATTGAAPGPSAQVAQVASNDRPLGEAELEPELEGAEEPEALPEFVVDAWGREIFRKRMRKPVRWVLAVSGVLLFAAFVLDLHPVLSIYVLIGTLLYLIYRLKVALPLLQARELHIAADHLSVRRGSHTLTVPWHDIASVTFTREKNNRRLALTAALDEGATTQIPPGLRGSGETTLKYTVVSSSKKETSRRANGLELALRSFAGTRYQQTYGAAR